MDDDYWFWQRYDALMHSEHEKGHPNSVNPNPNCPHCKKDKDSKNA